ncbi:Hypothetical predicted protein [Paramuricea clavata]|nr:Hypothetical predicted protein [Paramuricea clavata]
MDEFSPGEKRLHSEKNSNVSKNSSKKYQLRADVKQKIKQRLHRDKPKEDCTNNRTGITLPTANTGRKNLSKCNTTINKGSCIAKVAEKLWNMKRNPHLYNEKYPFYLCDRFIKHKNSKRPASGWIDNDRVKRLCLEPQDSHGKPGGRIGKDPAKTVKHLADGKTDNERLCRNLQKQTVEKTDKHNRHNDYPNSFSIQKDSDSVFECDSNTEEFSPQTEEILTDALNDREESSHERYVLNSGSYVIQSNQSRTINQESLSLEFKESQRICKPTSSELSDKENEFFPKGWYPKHCESKNGSHDESSRPKTWLSFNKSGGTINLDYNESRSIFKATSNREDNSEASKINMVRKYPSENSRQVRSPTSNKEKCTRELRVSLMDCFANLLHTRQNLSRGFFQTTSTPRAIRVPTKSQEVPTSPITPRVPTLHMTPRVLTSHTIPKVPTSAITPRVPTSHITAKVPKLHITPRMPTAITPPETEDESSFFTQKEQFEKDKFRGSSKENNEKATEGIVYKPLFSNKPRLWKSVVVENDS